MDKVEKLVSTINTYIPEAQLVSNDAGSLSFNVPNSAIEGVTNFVKFLEKSGK